MAPSPSLMLVLVPLLLLWCGALGVEAQTDGCERDIEEVLAECTKKHLDEIDIVPRNVRDLNSKCLSFKEAGLCLKNYAYRCMDEDARLKTGLILSGISHLGGNLCGSQNDKEDFISHMKCLNSTASRELMCRHNFMQVLRVTKYVRPELKVPVSCCYYNEFTKCLDNSFVEAGDKCSPQTYEYFRDLTLKFRTNTIDLLCGSKYNRLSERCDLIIGNPISGKDIIVKYLIGVFGTRDIDLKSLTSSPSLSSTSLSSAPLITSSSIFKRTRP